VKQQGTAGLFPGHEYAKIKNDRKFLFHVYTQLAQVVLSCENCCGRPRAHGDARHVHFQVMQSATLLAFGKFLRPAQRIVPILWKISPLDSLI
jgi:hypothetical protein